MLKNHCLTIVNTVPDQK